MNYIELSATVFGLIQGILILFNRRSNWIFYCVQMTLMVLFSYNARLYGDMVNSMVFLIMGIIGYITWNPKLRLHITVYTNAQRISILFLTFCLTVPLYIYLKMYTDDVLPLLDSVTTSTAFVATYMMMRRKLEAWAVWFFNDICYCVEYWMLPDKAVFLLCLNVIWTVMAVCSYLQWKKLLAKSYNHTNNS